ncbi:MAG: helix-turn-helix domain-containing protein [Chloroflexota bacterium]
MPRPTVAAVPGLLHWRVERAMTQAELADKSGVDRTTIARLERGTAAKMETIRRLADALKVEPSQLLHQWGDA